MLARASRLPAGDDLRILIGGILPGDMTGVDQVELAVGVGAHGGIWVRTLEWWSPPALSVPRKEAPCWSAIAVMSRLSTRRHSSPRPPPWSGTSASVRAPE